MPNLHIKEPQIYASPLLLSLDKHAELLAASAALQALARRAPVQYPSRATSHKAAVGRNKTPKQIARCLHLPRLSVSEGPIVVHVHEVTDLEVPWEP